MAEWVKVLVATPEFPSWDRPTWWRDPAPDSCPLNFMCALCTHENKRMQFKGLNEKLKL